MLYKHPFVLYLNLSVCLILLALALPALFNKNEQWRVRISFFLIFFTVIFTCIKNIQILHYEDNTRVAEIFMTICVPLSFGPLIYYYIKNMLGGRVNRWIYLSQLPGLAAFGYGVSLLTRDDSSRQQIFRQVMAGEHIFFDIINTLILLLTLFYCAKAWRYVNSPAARQTPAHLQVYQQIKRSWAREFLLYIFFSVLLFLLIVIASSLFTNILQTEIDLIVMPVFMLILYMLIAIRSMMMNKDFEYQFVLSKLETNNAILKERQELSDNLHDSLGAQLTLLNSMLDSVQVSANTHDTLLACKLEKLSALSENCYSELKNALWVLNSESVSAGNLRLKILNFIALASEARHDITFHSSFDLEDNTVITSKQAMNIFRMVQEITNNVLKHSGAGEMWLRMTMVENKLHLVLSDDGSGFNPREANDNSYGLMSIRKRIEEINGNLIFDSPTGKGTKYQIEVPL